MSIAKRVPESVEDLQISRHVMQRAKDRGIDESILSAALQSVGQDTELIEQAGEEMVLRFDDPLTADTFKFPLAFDEGGAVLQTAYRED